MRKPGVHLNSSLFLLIVAAPFWPAFALELPTLPAAPTIPTRTVLLNAPADGFTDATTAINSAIASLSQRGGGTLQFGSGTYLVSVNPNANDYVLQIQSNVQLLGSPAGDTVIQMAAGQGPYNALIGTAYSVHDVVIANITFDLNGQNNPIRSEADNLAGVRNAIRIDQGPRIRIAGCTVTNVADVNTFVFSGTVTDVEVANNAFQNVGQLPGSFDYDHSTIYTHAVRIWIHDNTFTARSGPGTPGARTAIETHGDDQTITHNTIDGYQNGMNITGQASSSNRQLYNNNIITNTMYGMEIWSMYWNGNTTQPALQNVTIQNNQITLNPVAWRVTGLIDSNAPSDGIFLTPNPLDPAPIAGLAILGNQITFPAGVAPQWGDSYSGGIMLWSYSGVMFPVAQLTISGNQITNALGPAIWSNFTLTQGATISSNTVIDPARSSSSNQRTGIYISGQTANIQIEDNTVSDSASPPLITSGTSAVSICDAQCTVGGNSVTPSQLPPTVLGPGWVAAALGMSLQYVPGALQQVSIAADGSVWGINASGQIYRFDATTGSFVHVPGSLKQIVAGGDGSVWGINGSGSIYRYDTSAQTWIRVPGALAQIAVGADGDVWGVNGAGYVYHWNSAAQTWVNVPGTLTQIAVGFNGAVWGLDGDGQIYRYHVGLQSLIAVAGPSLSQISVGTDGAVWGLDSSENIYRFNPLEQAFDAIPGNLAQISVGSAGQVWGVNSQNAIYHYDLFLNQWVNAPGTLAQISAAADGSVWGLGPASNILQAAPQYAFAPSFHQVPGVRFIQIATSPDGNAWGIDPSGNLYAYNLATQSWVAENAGTVFAQVAVAFGQDVWALDANHAIYHYNPSSQTLEPVAGELVQLAVGANGSVWGLNENDEIYTYDPQTSSFIQVPGALNEISTGPDGTTWGLNTASQIFRFDPAAQTWVEAPGFLTSISATSGGSAWGLNGANEIYTFDTATQQWIQVPGALVEVSSGFDGTVWGINGAGEIYRADPQTVWDNLPGTLAHISVSAQSVVWGLDAQGNVYRFY